jgi:hypothetical protein
MKQRLLTKKIAIYFLILPLVLSLFITYFPSKNVYAAGIPGGNNFIFVSNLGLISICQYQNISQSQAEDACTGLVGGLPKGVSTKDYNIYFAVGPSGSSYYYSSGSNEISVPNTTPQGIVNGKLKSGVHSYPITISGYKSALGFFNDILSHCGNICIKGPTGVLNGSQLSGSPQTVTVNSTVYDNSASVGQSLGPITYYLTDISSGNPIATVTSTTSSVQKIANGLLQAAKFTVNFSNVSPGIYNVSSSSIQSSPVPVTVPSNTTVELDGNYVPPSSSNNSAPTCESSSFPLAWITCAAINEMGSIESYLENLVGDLMTTQTLVYNSKDCQSNNSSSNAQSCIYKVWNNFRVYGDVILIIALLVIVFAESIGGGLLDAYSIRKILPRLIIAAILINLSIYIVGVLMDITNILGKGIFNIIKSPFPTSVWKIDPTGAAGGIVGVTLTALVALVLYAIFKDFKNNKGKGILSAAIGLLFLIGLPFLLAMLGIIATIIFRIAIIYFLVIISPLAFALYCLPNTEQYFRKWWKILIEALIVYPIVMIVFAMSGVTAVILSSIPLPGSVSWLTQIFSMAAVLAPLFLIPFAFKIAGNTIGSVHDMVTKGRNGMHGMIRGNPNNPNSLHNRMRGRLEKSRNEMGLSNAQIGARFNPKRLTKKGRKAFKAEISNRGLASGYAIAAKELEANDIWNQNKNDEKFLTAYGDRDLAKQRIAEAEADKARALDAGDLTKAAKLDNTIAAYNDALDLASKMPDDKSSKMVALYQRAATGFGVAYGKKGYEELRDSVIKATGVKVNEDGSVDTTDPNYGNYRRSMNGLQFAYRQAGRYDIGMVNDGAGYTYGIDKASGYIAGQGKPETFLAGAEEYLGLDDGQAEDLSASTILRSIASGATDKNKFNDYVRLLSSAYPTATMGNQKVIMKQLEAMHEAAKSQGSGFNAEEVARLSQQISYIKSASTSRNLDPNLIDT